MIKQDNVFDNVKHIEKCMGMDFQFSGWNLLGQPKTIP